MSMKLRVTGGKEIQETLALLARTTAKNVQRRGMAQALEPVASAARALAPIDSGDLEASIGIAPRAYRARPRPDGVGVMYVGPTWPQGAHAHLVEFGTGPRFHKSGRYVGAMPPDPFLRPAWDANKAQVLERLADAIRAEIAKTVGRRVKRAMKAVR
jgi:HK97 gp10 family phage protein